MLNVSIIMYLDDILIYSNGNLSQHCVLVHQVLHHLHKHKLFVKAEKCAFHTGIWAISSHLMASLWIL